MADGDPRDQIARLEAHIEKLAETVEGCRKLMLASKIAIALGGLTMAAIFLGALRPDPVAMTAAMAAVICGIVVFGSNASTSKQAEGQMRDAEALRAELIGLLELRVIEAAQAGRDTGN